MHCREKFEIVAIPILEKSKFFFSIKAQDFRELNALKPILCSDCQGNMLVRSQKTETLDILYSKKNGKIITCFFTTVGIQNFFY